MAATVDDPAERPRLADAKVAHRLVITGRTATEPDGGPDAAKARMSLPDRANDTPLTLTSEPVTRSGRRIASEWWDD